MTNDEASEAAHFAIRLQFAICNPQFSICYSSITSILNLNPQPQLLGVGVAQGQLYQRSGLGSVSCSMRLMSS